MIVEDEKLIRQGIRAMIQRSGVPVEVLMECGNGEMALEILQSQKVDVMFTDIRMPKVNGIELVQRMQELPHKPITIAISGYADFAYAVEMLRLGVREYLLKPVEREKLWDILRKLEQEITQKQESSRTSRRLGRQQLKYLMLNGQITEEELHTMQSEYESELDLQSYYVYATNPREYTLRERTLQEQTLQEQTLQERTLQEPDFQESAPKEAAPVEDNYIYLHNVEGSDIYLVTEKNAELLLKNELVREYVGTSTLHGGIRKLREAYGEAVEARGYAFCRERKVYRFHEEEKQIPDNFYGQGKKLVGAEMKLQRVQLLGTDKTEELTKAWNGLFYAVRNGWVSPPEFAECIGDFFREMRKTYRNALTGEEGKLERLAAPFGFPALSAWQTEFMDWLLAFHERLGSQFDTNRNQKKIRLAVDYIRENYGRDLNMAVVSNHISMNYSLFSYLFKEYTGSNFVNYLKGIRMEEAKKLLAGTDMRIMEISARVGYENEKHFMKTFKASCGVSPSEYRKIVKTDE